MSIFIPKILMVLRDERFSPDAVEKDAAILHAVGDCLKRRGANVSYVKEGELLKSSTAIGADVGVIFSMARSEAALAELQHAEADGVMVINSTRSVDVCSSRHAIDGLMRSNQIPAAPYYQKGAGWVKADRGHEVHFAANEQEVMALKTVVENPVITGHVKGESLKFYGVAGRFFHPSGYPELRQATDRLARQVGICVYGGDAVVRDDGSFAIVDFNDWPSFACCREEAAAAISNLI